jgi:glycine cleavage system pyridoxal-binding protein P
VYHGQKGLPAIAGRISRQTAILAPRAISRAAR